MGYHSIACQDHIYQDHMHQDIKLIQTSKFRVLDCLSEDLESLLPCKITHGINTYEFICPETSEKETLGSFCVFCIDCTYGTRTCSDKEALEFFEISDHEILSGYVEKLCDIDSKKLVGFYSLTKWFMSEDGIIVIELGSLFVHPDFQRRGLGTVLFRRAIAAAKSFNCTKLQWISDPHAELFYEAFGAVKTMYVHNILDPAVPSPWFELWLS